MTSPFATLAENVAAVVFDPDYYSGPWFTQFTFGGHTYRRTCNSYSSAKLWAAHIQRRFGNGSWSAINLCVGKVLPETSEVER